MPNCVIIYYLYTGNKHWRTTSIRLKYMSDYIACSLKQPSLIYGKVALLHILWWYYSACNGKQCQTLDTFSLEQNECCRHICCVEIRVYLHSKLSLFACILTSEISKCVQRLYCTLTKEILVYYDVQMYFLIPRSVGVVYKIRTTYSLCQQA